MPTKVIVEISGGVCQAVYSTDPHIEVDLLDYDNYKALQDETEPLTESQKSEKQGYEASEREVTKLHQVF